MELAAASRAIPMVHMVRRSLLTSPLLPPLLGALVSSLLRGMPRRVLKYPFIENVLNVFSSMGSKAIPTLSQNAGLQPARLSGELKASLGSCPSPRGQGSEIV